MPGGGGRCLAHCHTPGSRAGALCEVSLTSWRAVRAIAHALARCATLDPWRGAETEWFNFLERVGVGTSAAEESRLFKEKHLLDELRLWASFRGQTLTRTVEGMMLHERALKLLASWEGLHNGELGAKVVQKFQYVVSCQAYGNHKRARDLKAVDTEFLLHRYPSLRVAYVDKASSLTKVSESDGRSSLKEAIRFYSVLIKGVKQVPQPARLKKPGDRAHPEPLHRPRARAVLSFPARLPARLPASPVTSPRAPPPPSSL